MLTTSQVRDRPARFGALSSRDATTISSWRFLLAPAVASATQPDTQGMPVVLFVISVDKNDHTFKWEQGRRAIAEKMYVACQTCCDAIGHEGIICVGESSAIPVSQAPSPRTHCIGEMSKECSETLRLPCWASLAGLRCRSALLNPASVSAAAIWDAQW